MQVSHTGFDRLCERGVLASRTAGFVGYALFSCSESDVLYDEPPCNSLPRACVLVSWFILRLRTCQHVKICCM